MAVPPAYLAAVKAAAVTNHVPAQLLAAQIQAESGWNPNAHSPAGADGISQFMPGTAKSYGLTNTRDPIASIAAQGRMMGSLLKSYHGNTALALAAYNAGSGAVAAAGGKVPNIPETQNYIKNIMGYEKNYPGLAQTSVGGLAPTTVKRATDYSNIISSVSNPSVAASKASSVGVPSDSSSSPNDPSTGLLGYLLHQSVPGHGTSNDSTTALTNILSMAQQATNSGQATPSSTTAAPTLPIVRDTTQPVDPKETHIVSLAKQYLGVKYQWGGSSPTTGFDCSGFVQFVNHLGGNKSVPRTTYQQLSAGKPVAKADLKPGDAVFFNGGEHEGMYIGNGKFIQAPHTGDVVKISDLNTYPGFYGARRFGK